MTYTYCHGIYCVELEQARKQAELDKKSFDDLVRERDILSKVRVHV